MNPVITPSRFCQIVISFSLHPAALYNDLNPETRPGFAEIHQAAEKLMDSLQPRMGTVIAHAHLSEIMEWAKEEGRLA